jgi:hypothetical protein
VQPARQRLATPERANSRHQDEERGLEGVVRLVGVVEDAPADAEDHRAVTLDERGEGELGRLAVASGEAVEELRVGQSGHRADVEQGADLADDGVVAGRRHRCPSLDRAGRLDL